MSGHDDTEPYLELLDEPDALDEIATGALVAAITTAPGRVGLVFGYQLADRFTPDPRFAEVAFSPAEAVTLALELAHAGAVAAREPGEEPPAGIP